MISVAICLLVVCIKGRLAVSEQSKNELSTETERLRHLVEQLEGDLLVLDSPSSKRSFSGVRLEESDSKEGHSAAEYLAQEFTESGDVEKRNPAGNMLAIVAAQRNRLRLRVEELEKSEMSEKAHAAGLQSELEQARQDNVQLYGKIKFLQSLPYRTLEHPNRISQGVSLEENDAEQRYQNEYEQHIDPFKKFTAQERQRKYGQLRAHDKAALQLGRWMMSSAQSRTIFLFYLLFLHLLVFLVLYRFAYTESCQRDFQADCIAKYRSHMHQFHPGEEHNIV